MKTDCPGVCDALDDPADGRRTPIEVTEDVRRYVGELEEGASGRLARVLKAATPAERAATRKGLALLTQLLGSRRHGEEP
jgi:DNA-binding MarR family transcriptional regulator